MEALGVLLMEASCVLFFLTTILSVLIDCRQDRFTEEEMRLNEQAHSNLAPTPQVIELLAWQNGDYAETDYLYAARQGDR